MIEKNILEERKSPIAFVTGGSGYLGSEIAKKFQTEGYEVLKINTITKFSSAEEYGEYISDLLMRYRPSSVINCAADQSLKDSVEQTIRLLYSNTIAPAVILAAIKETNTQSNYLTISSSWQYNENGSYEPLTMYASSKQALVDVMQYFSKYVATASLILFDTYGANDKRSKILNLIIDSCLKGKNLKMTAGEQVIDLTDVVDAACAVWEANKLVTEGKLSQWAIRSGNVVKIKELIELLPEKYRGLFDMGSLNYREKEIFAIYDDFALVPGWKPTNSLENFLKKMLPN
jgi:CDP-3, 6-dideoxy-D-glycero-L-glycero-4-hexulose-4-reductase